MFERRVFTQRLFGLFLPAVCGYLLALYTLTTYDEPQISSSKNYGKLEVDLRRNTRSLLSLQQDNEKHSCECQTNFKTNSGLKVNYFGNSFVTDDIYEKAVIRRSERLEKWEKRTKSKSPINAGTILYTTNIPVIFPYYGLEVTPLGEINIPILKIMPLFEKETSSSTDSTGDCLGLDENLICVILYAHYGSILFKPVLTDVKITYENALKKSVTLISDSLDGINRAFEKMTYKSTEYEPKGSTDVMTLRYGPHKAQIPIRIEYKKMPILIDQKSSQLDDMVTICIKTFERYSCLNRLINSITEFYPKIRIIVADDSINFKEIEYKNVQQFKMPPGIGFNNGKNLAISQVVTEYFVWVDDDFFFTAETDLPWMLNLLENTDLDLVGGKAGASHWGYTSIIDRLQGGIEGDCLYRTYGSRGKIDNFPTCVIADVIQNFYMARTLAVRAVGFDGLFRRISHKEFFLDAVGTLKIGFCENLTIGHSHSCLATMKQLNKYTSYREPNEQELSFIDQSWFHRSNLKCISEKKLYGNNKFFNLTTIQEPSANTL